MFVLGTSLPYLSGLHRGSITAWQMSKLTGPCAVQGSSVLSVFCVSCPSLSFSDPSTPQGLPSHSICHVPRQLTAVVISRQPKRGPNGREQGPWGSRPSTGAGGAAWDEGWPACWPREAPAHTSHRSVPASVPGTLLNAGCKSRLKGHQEQLLAESIFAIILY